MINPFDTEERRTFRDNITRFTAKEVTPYCDAWDEAGEIPWAIHEQLGAMGFFGFGVSEEYGGLGFDDCFMRVAGAEELARCGAGGVSAAIGGRIISIEPEELLPLEPPEEPPESPPQPTKPRAITVQKSAANTLFILKSSSPSYKSYL